MSQKVKPRQMRKPRNQVVLDMILNTKGGPHKDRREKRKSNPRNQERWDDHGL